ncbi:hypothetical protein T11_7402 [Trichinella zimbabwensis]|uniref:Uncharacterized protein n=1 Tax=Trichinella zimbabwensis TaxID=268475 RepID=A0A0V1HY97_9BILA|nr:hypothetical protein T11_7402 [Trichinella zimbabwensis]
MRNTACTPLDTESIEEHMTAAKYAHEFYLTLGKDLLCQKSSNSTCMCMGVVQEKENDKAAFSGLPTTLVDHHHHLGCPSVQQINYAYDST